MRTVGRQAVCRDTGIPHYFDRGKVVVVVVVVMVVVVPVWMRSPSHAEESVRSCVSLVESSCCHLDTVLGLKVLRVFHNHNKCKEKIDKKLKYKKYMNMVFSFIFYWITNEI